MHSPGGSVSRIRLRDFTVFVEESLLLEKGTRNFGRGCVRLPQTLHSIYEITQFLLAHHEPQLAEPEPNIVSIRGIVA